jgi:hypothetical protein
MQDSYHTNNECILTMNALVVWKYAALPGNIFPRVGCATALEIFATVFLGSGLLFLAMLLASPLTSLMRMQGLSEA